MHDGPLVNALKSFFDVDDQTRVTIQKFTSAEQCRPHREKSNVSDSYFAYLGNCSGGPLALEDGSVFNLQYTWYRYSGGDLLHWVEPFDGERIGLIVHKVQSNVGSTDAGAQQQPQPLQQQPPRQQQQPQPLKQQPPQPPQPTPPGDDVRDAVASSPVPLSKAGGSTDAGVPPPPQPKAKARPKRKPKVSPPTTHNLFTHFPKDPNCPVCKLCKTARALPQQGCRTTRRFT